MIIIAIAQALASPRIRPTGNGLSVSARRIGRPILIAAAIASLASPGVRAAETIQLTVIDA